MCIGSEAALPSSAVLRTSTVTSSHVTSAMTTGRDVTSNDDNKVTSNDLTASLFIGALLFIPVSVILCVTVVIRLRKSGMSCHVMSCHVSSRYFLLHIEAWPSGNSPTKNHEDRPRGSPPTGALNAKG